MWGGKVPIISMLESGRIFMCVHVYMCTWVYMGMFLCVRVNKHIPQHMCGGQTPALTIDLHLPSCLRPGLFFAVCWLRQASGPTAFGSAVSVSSLAIGALGLQMCATTFSFCPGSGDSNSGSHNGTASVLSTEQSPQPMAPFSKEGKATVPTPTLPFSGPEALHCF